MSYRSRGRGRPGIGYVLSAIVAGILAAGVTGYHGGGQPGAAAEAGTPASLAGGHAAAGWQAAAGQASTYPPAQPGQPDVGGGPTRPRTRSGVDRSAPGVVA